MAEWKLHRPSSTTSAMSPRMSSRVRSSMAAACFGAKRGSRIFRKFLWSGGSICSGMSGRIWPMCTASMPEE